MTRAVLAAVAQLTSVPDVATNLKTVVDLIKHASHVGAKMIFFPEASDFIAPAASVASLSQQIADSETNVFVDGVKAAARESNIWINIGVHELPPAKLPQNKCYNTNLLISGRGLITALYRKVHLFDVDLAPDGPTIKESDTTIPGDRLVSPIQTPVGLLGLQTCYDIRFTQSSYQLTSMGAQSLTYPSAFATHTGAAHWETLLRSRAIENQCYIFGSAQIGEHFPGRRTYGHSMIIDPWGTIVTQCSQVASREGQLSFAYVDLNYVTKIRREMPMGWP